MSLHWRLAFQTFIRVLRTGYAGSYTVHPNGYSIEGPIRYEHKGAAIPDDPPFAYPPVHYPSKEDSTQ